MVVCAQPAHVLALHLGHVRLHHVARRGVELQYDGAHKRWIEIDEQARAKVLLWPHGVRSLWVDNALAALRGSAIKGFAALAAVMITAAIVSVPDRIEATARPVPSSLPRPRLLSPIPSIPTAAEAQMLPPVDVVLVEANRPRPARPATSAPAQRSTIEQPRPAERAGTAIARKAAAGNVVQLPPLPLLPLPQAGAPESSAQQGAKQGDADLVLVDRSTHERQPAPPPAPRIESTEIAKVVAGSAGPKPSPQRQHEKQPAKAAARDTHGAAVRLLAVLPNAAVVSDPSTGLPTQINVGGKLPSGEKLQRVDRVNGVVFTDTREIHLE